MLSKIDVRQVVRDHIATLHRNGSTKTSFSDLLLFFGVPIVVAVIAWCKFFGPNTDINGPAIAAFSIFTALLLNLQVLILNAVAPKRPSPNVDADEGKFSYEEIKAYENYISARRNLLLEVSANISYQILISLVVIVIYLTAIFVTYDLLEAFGLYLVAHFLLNMLMILKRVHVVFSDDIANGGGAS